ncbi:MAG: hypothetical protein FWG65_09325 [Turicibacter sp.]|nr:hypothetical protein [Turicibacter sp.]
MEQTHKYFLDIAEVRGKFTQKQGETQVRPVFVLFRRGGYYPPVIFAVYIILRF